MDERYYKLKKLVQELEAKKGRHTELVTVYIPQGYNIHEIVNQLRDEQSTAENIKSKSTRKNVVTALERIIRRLQLYTKTPENGLAVFCGNVSEREGWPDIELWTIEPPEPINVKMYWCDQRFRVEPLKDMVREKEIYGLICLDKNEADVALLKGKKIVPLVHMDSIIPGKTRAGGQSSARFSRIREALKNDFLKRVGEAASKAFEGNNDLKGILVGGTGGLKEEFVKGDYLNYQIRDKVLGTVDTAYTGEFGLQEMIERGEDLIKEASIYKEKKILERFFAELRKQKPLATYGIDQTMKALSMGAVDTILLSEATDIVELIDENGNSKFVYENKIDGEKYVKKIPLIDVIDEKAAQFGTKVEIISRDTREGEQFYELGGIGAILRYEIE